MRIRLGSDGEEASIIARADAVPVHIYGALTSVLGSREVWHEGFRYAPMKLYEKGELRREVWDLILRNTRLPELIEVDVDAMIGGCRVGEDRIRSLCDKYGPSSPTSSTSTSRSRARGRTTAPASPTGRSPTTDPRLTSR